MAKGVKKKYDALRKKHKLPGFEELDAEFEISDIEPDGSVLREVRKKIADKIGHVCGTVEQVLHPETNLADLYESRVLDEQEKKELFEMYKKLMAAERKCVELFISSDEKLDAAFIKSFSAEWKTLKPQLIKLVRKLKESWEKETDEGEAAGYMG
ncbi:hypothetical protein HYU16_05310 [Candidatus Woesearchaeota archaeon]|nr:hypothetical protein [Candidatus Woesearchaeota archaeon]